MAPSSPSSGIAAPIPVSGIAAPSHTSCVLAPSLGITAPGHSASVSAPRLFYGGKTMQISTPGIKAPRPISGSTSPTSGVRAPRLGVLLTLFYGGKTEEWAAPRDTHVDVGGFEYFEAE
jgi:hypothetical protein